MSVKFLVKAISLLSDCPQNKPRVNEETAMVFKLRRVGTND